ncbi:hypothetical protein [Dolichospermum sp. UHCC 0259]|uniref:hypothetical protein n=1 Tax=Dolichospermum sp. UHCC 0259 TaxID=2590010 RepID=UPI0020C3A270|nr:hypothetical protein [Dolichospermum sp. UHCC 0259]
MADLVNSDRTPQLPNSDRTPSTPKQRSHSLQLPNSDSYGALRYRTPQLLKQRYIRSASLSQFLHHGKKSDILAICENNQIWYFMINNHQSTTAKSSAKTRNDLLLEIEHTPEEYIPELLQIVRLFRQSVTMKQTSLKNWENAINEINESDAIKKEHRKTNIKRLFESWNESDDQQEQQETLEIIESMNGILI